MTVIELIKQPWPWYVAGPLIGLMVPTLLIFGNKTFGISSSLRHVCQLKFHFSVMTGKKKCGTYSLYLEYSLVVSLRPSISKMNQAWN